jgi:hypothetical protein
MRQLFRAQVDLFVTPARPIELTGVERQMAVALLRVLLTEAVMTLTNDRSTSKKQEEVDE